MAVECFSKACFVEMKFVIVKDGLLGVIFAKDFWLIEISVLNLQLALISYSIVIYSRRLWFS